MDICICYFNITLHYINKKVWGNTLYFHENNAIKNNNTMCDV